MDNKVSNVNVGSIAGVNKGIISNCHITTAYNRPYFNCYAKGDSYMGCFVGSNEGVIEDCYNGDWLDGTCNMGTIAGKNSGTIRNCNVGNGNDTITFSYSDYNACVGGVVGLQVAGSITNCSFQGRIVWSLNYYSETEYAMSENREMQPCVGIIVGYLQGGTISGSSWKTEYGADKIVLAQTPPKVVEWETGALWWQEKHTHDQGLYFKNEECGRR